MKPSHAFEQIDHPLIGFAQVVLAIALFRLFFAVRRTPAPLPQIIAIAAFAVLTNLAARVSSADWFVYSDIVIYWAWAIATIASVMSVTHANEQAAKQPNPPILVPDFFDRWQTKVVWAFGLIAVGLFLYGYLNTYDGKRTAEATATVKADSAVTVATQEYSAQQKIYQGERQQIISGIASVTAVLPTLTSGLASVSATQTTLIAGQKNLSRRVAHNQMAFGRSRPGVPDLKKIETHKDTLIKRKIEAPATTPIPKEKPGFFKRLFGGKSVPDTTNYARADTLASH